MTPALRAELRRHETLPVAARSVSEMYRKLNTLQTHGLGGWKLVRVPWWRGGMLHALLARQEAAPPPPSAASGPEAQR